MERETEIQVEGERRIHCHVSATLTDRILKPEIVRIQVVPHPDVKNRIKSEK